MTESTLLGERVRISPSGLMFLAITSVGWGINWPINKYLISELPPLTMRGSTGVVGALLLAVVAMVAGQDLHVPVAQWPRLLLGGRLNVASWTVFVGMRRL